MVLLHAPSLKAVDARTKKKRYSHLRRRFSRSFPPRRRNGCDVTSRLRLTSQNRALLRKLFRVSLEGQFPEHIVCALVEAALDDVTDVAWFSLSRHAGVATGPGQEI